MWSSVLKFWFHANSPTKDATEVMPELLTNGSIATTLPTKHVHLTRHMDMTMVSDVQQWSNARTVSHRKDAGLKRDLKSTALMNSETLLDKRTWWTKSSKEDLSPVPLQWPKNSSTIPEVSSTMKPEGRNLTTISQSLVGVKRMELNIGLSETPGEATGDKEETSDWSEERITSVFKALAHGQLPPTLGLKTSGTRPSHTLRT